ncbi:MAG TPA: hypothetical protein PKA16_01300 [Ottowia sp.]|uniref:hypothetical protein n=1 Tax=Ottowia sp. TaxID=1898956 RepID=UPI002B747B86|nr:hypothetical protein [Ottowia sp.]HMN20008.1 hypothetical protein [Ottowia sp.]
MVLHRFVLGIGRSRSHSRRADSACRTPCTPIERDEDTLNRPAATAAARAAARRQRWRMAVLFAIAVGAAWWACRGTGAAEPARGRPEQAARRAVGPVRLPAAYAEHNFDRLPHRTARASDPRALEHPTTPRRLDLRQAERAHPVMRVTPVGFVLRPDGAQASAGAAQEAQAQACPPGERRVVPHIASGDAMQLLQAATGSLLAAGFDVPPHEAVPAARMPRKTDLRYFRRGEQQGVDAAAAALAQSGLGRLEPKYVEGYENSTSLRRCHFELWLVVPARGPQS